MEQILEAQENPSGQFKLYVQHQESYSRGELLLRSFFGNLYMVFPHSFMMMFVAIWAGILGFIAFWAILFTGKYPQSMFNFQVKFMRWGIRLNSRMLNLVDGYPSFFPKGEDDKTNLIVPYPENMSRGLLLLKAFFGYLYVAIPHYFILFFRMIWGVILAFVAWWVVLFTGRYPKSWHEFQVGTIRWSTRVGLYLANMTDNYPPFSGKE